MFYIVTAHKPDSVSQVLSCNFTAENDLNCIVCKWNCMYIYLFVGNQLKLIMTCPVNGRITNLMACKLNQRNTQSLLLTTEKNQLSILSWSSSSNCIVTDATGDISDIGCRPADCGQLVAIDWQSRLIGLHLTQGLLKIIPMAVTGKLSIFGDGFNVSLEKLDIISTCFLYSNEELPKLAVLFHDFKEIRRFVTYTVSIEEKSITETKFGKKVEQGALFMIPIPITAGGGLVVVGEQSLVYYNQQTTTSATIPPTIMKCYTVIDDTRYLLSDYQARLYIMALKRSPNGSFQLQCSPIGKTVQASSLAYLSDGYVYVGSHFGDSQLIKLSSGRDNSKPIIVKETFPNLAPITDFCVVDIEKEGQGQIVACSGAYQDGSLRIIRNGIGIDSLAELENMEQLINLWSLKKSNSQFDSLLLLSFIDSTRVLHMVDSVIVEFDGMSGFAVNRKTLCAANVGNSIIQVTQNAILTLSSSTFAVNFSWKNPEDSVIIHASIHNADMVVSLTGGRLLYFKISSNGECVLIEDKLLNSEISCLNIAKIGTTTFCAVGFWTDSSIRMLMIPSLVEVSVYDVLANGMCSIPRSVLITTLEDISYLMVGLGDGTLCSFFLSPTGTLSESKKVALGTQPVILQNFTSENNTFVFASSDRPTVIYSRSSKLLFSNVNLRHVTCISTFNTSISGNSIAIVSDGALTIGTIETVQKLHIKTIPLGETARRIAYDECTRTFTIVASTYQVGDDGQTVESSCVKLLDGITYEVLDTFKLDEFELAASLVCVTFVEEMDEKSYMIVGTGVAYPTEDEPTQGRILVFSVVNRRLELVNDYATTGCVYSMVTVHGKLVAAVNSKILLLTWDGSTTSLNLTSTHFGNVLALSLASRGDFVIVGDLLKSISILMYNPITDALEERARDYDSNWMTSVEAMDDDLFIGSDNNYNIFACKKNNESVSMEEQKRLVPFGKFHLGELVNRFRKGSLVMNQPDQPNNAIPHLLFCTVNGSIGVIAKLDKKMFDVLSKVQIVMESTLVAVGNLSHSKWREFQNARKKEPSTNFIDGDLIESYLELSAAQQQSIVKLLTAQGIPFTVEELTRTVEDLARVH
ncbi:CPSF A subunit region-domain-containing protein [Globomyces pollinis-pini]|nr:CPSF A subunit region-domain-containing protein [Globomyces pollinis-pini]